MEKNEFEKDNIVEGVKAKSDLEFKINVGKASKIRLGYIGVAFLLMFTSIYKISLMGYTDSVSIMNFALGGLNVGTLYLIVLIVALAVELVVALQDHDFVKTNKEMLNLGLPLCLLLFSVYFVFKGFSLRKESMGIGTISWGLFLGVAVHLGFLVYTKFPDKVEELIKNVTDKQS